MRLRAREVEVNTNRTVRQVGIAAHQTVAIGTPVDTGQARSNWIVTLITPSSATRPPFAPGRNLGRGERENLTAVLQEGQQIIGARRNEQDIWISNNLPYIGRLNEGFSAQAPAMFVEQAVQQAAQVVANARIFVIP